MQLYNDTLGHDQFTSYLVHGISLTNFAWTLANFAKQSELILKHQ